MLNEFDLIVIGTGAAGQSIAYECQSQGLDVVVIDSRRYGGTCALRGCDPKKVLVGAAEVIDSQQRLQGHGITGNAQIDWSELMQFRATFTEPVPEHIESSFESAGITILHGRASFLDKQTLKVGDKTVKAQNFAIATGAKPRDLNIDGEEYLTSSAEFLYLDDLPERIVFVGGGYIAFEFAHIAARAGCKVTILESHETPLRHFDIDLVTILLKASRDTGIEFHNCTIVEAIEKTKDEFIVHASTNDNKKTYTADLVVHSAGRVPEIADLNLKQADIKHSKKGIAVNDYLQSTSNPSVYAAGDAADSRGLALTPIASLEGHVVASNLVNKAARKVDYTATPSVVFSIPALAHVGLTEAQAKAQDLQFTVKHEETSGWYSSKRVNLKHSGFKVLISNETEQILGADLLSHHAADTINLFALAIRNGLTSSDIKDTILSYPSDSADIGYML